MQKTAHSMTPEEIQRSLEIHQEVHRRIGIVTEEYYVDTKKIHSESSVRMDVLRDQLIKKIKRSFLKYAIGMVTLIVALLISILTLPTIWVAFFSILVIAAIMAIDYFRRQEDRKLDQKHRNLFEDESRIFQETAEKLRRDNAQIIDTILSDGIDRMAAGKENTSALN